MSQPQSMTCTAALRKSMGSTWYSVYPLTIQQPRPIHIYCNNVGVIAWINGHPKEPQPHDTLCDDYPIFAEVQCLVALLHPYQLQFHHVKGHQDQKKNQPLSIQEQLNIDCDKHASSLPPPLSNINLYWHPPLIAGYSHLCLGTSVVAQKRKHTLHDEATQPTYFEYLTDKFPGITSPATDIHLHTKEVQVSRMPYTL